MELKNTVSGCVGRVFLFAVAVFLPGMGAQGQGIGGSVKDCEGRRALEGATVRIAEQGKSCRTDALGRYLLENLEAGVHVIEFSFVGMETLRREIRIDRKHKVLDVCMAEANSELAELVVVAKSPLQRVRESSFNVTALDAAALHNTSLDISHALDRISGVKLRETGGMGSGAQISLNGFSGRHVKIFMDGMPMEGFGSAFRINNIPVHLADRIEVYKGVVPVELGTDALGGAVNIVTLQGQRRRYVDASYSFGSFNTHRSNIHLGLSTGNGFFLRFNAYQNYSDNSYRVKTRLLDLTTNTYSSEDYWFRRFHDNYHNEALVARAGVMGKAWADRLQMELTASREKQDIQNANLMKIVYGGRARRAQSFIPALNYAKRNLLVENLHLRVTANYSVAHNNHTDTLARQYNWRGEYRTKGVKGEGQYSMSEYDNRNGTAVVHLHYRWTDRHTFTFNNLTGSFSRKASDAVANIETSTAATFMRRTHIKNVAGLSYRFEPSTRWQAAAFFKRYDVRIQGPVNVSTTSTAVYEEQTRTFDTEGYGVATTYRLSDSWQLKASYEKAYRLPSENELFGDEALETGNVALKPENSDNLNFNVNYDHTFNRRHSLYLDAGFIYRDTRDYIRRQIEQRYGGAYYTNHGQVRNYGVDLEARYFYKKTFSFGGNITFQDIRNQEKYSASGRKLIYYKDRMPNVPYLFGNVDANYNLSGCFVKNDLLSFGYNMRYVHSFFRDWQSEGGDIIIPRQLSHDLSVLYSFHDGRYNLALEVHNLADEILYDNYSLQKPGRNFLIKWRYFFSK
jgi:outer membrane receptor protein involved in Fe transport